MNTAIKDECQSLLCDSRQTTRIPVSLDLANRQGDEIALDAEITLCEWCADEWQIAPHTMIDARITGRV